MHDLLAGICGARCAEALPVLSEGAGLRRPAIKEASLQKCREVLLGPHKKSISIRGAKNKHPPGGLYFLRRLFVSIFYAAWRYAIVMGKSSTAFEFRETSDAVREWADAETRAFLERPGYSAPFGKALRVILVAAMAAASVKIAWLLIVHA